MTEHVPGITVPDSLIDEIAAAQDKVVAGTAMSARIIKAIRPMCQGLHIMAIGWESHIPSILDQAEVT